MTSVDTSYMGNKLTIIIYKMQITLKSYWVRCSKYGELEGVLAVYLENIKKGRDGVPLHMGYGQTWSHKMVLF